MKKKNLIFKSITAIFLILIAYTGDAISENCGYAITPEADFSYLFTDGDYAPAQVQFIDISDYTAATRFMHYYWDFGDGSSSSEKEPAHVYNEPGTYTVTFTIDWGSGSNSCVSIITVKERPLATIKTSPGQDRLGVVHIIENESVMFSNLSTGDYHDFEWRQEGCRPRTEDAFTETYTYAGNYKVTLVLKDISGSIVGNDEVTISVESSDAGHDQSGYGESGYGRWPGGDPSVRYIPGMARIRDAECDYLIIAAYEFYGSPALKDFAEYRSAYSGLDVIITYATALDAAIKEYIVDMYTACGGINYLLLVGDTDLLPTHIIVCDDTQAQDIAERDEWYADIDDDGFADIAMGRFPVSTEEELDNMFKKIYEYEQAGNGPGSFHGRVTAVMGTTPDAALLHFIEVLRMLGFDVTDLFHEEGDGLDELMEAWALGQGLIYYDGHGLPDSWEYGRGEGFTLGNIAGLEFAPFFPVIIAESCLTASLDPAGDSIGEYLVTSPTGAVAYFGATLPTGNITNTIAGIIGEALYDGVLTLGEAILLGAFFDERTSDDFVLLGDPALQLFGCRATEELPDMAFYGSRVLYEGNTVTVSVINEGEADARDVLVNVYSVNPDTDARTLLCEIVFDVIKAGSVVSSSRIIRRPPEGHLITARIDPYDTIEEHFEANNSYVSGTNVPPYINRDKLRNPIAMRAGEETRFKIEVIDPDTDESSLVYQAKLMRMDGTPVWEYLDDGIFSYTPALMDVYVIYGLDIKVCDGISCDTEYLEVKVETDENVPPVISYNIAGLASAASKPYGNAQMTQAGEKDTLYAECDNLIMIFASDYNKDQIDVHIPDEVPLPEGSTFEKSTETENRWLFNWSPSPDLIGTTRNFKFIARDEHGAEDSVSFTVSIVEYIPPPPNRSPVIELADSVPTPVVAVAGTDLSIDLKITEPDGDQLREMQWSITPFPYPDDFHATLAKFTLRRGG